MRRGRCAARTRRCGVMTVRRIVERFIVEHLEEHATQLDSLDR